MKKREKELKVKEDLTLKIQQIGLWTGIEDVEMGLERQTTKKAKTFEEKYLTSHILKSPSSNFLTIAKLYRWNN